MVIPVKRHVYEEEFPLSRDKVWELLSNTDHLNRIIGLFPIRSSSFRYQNTDFIQELSAKVAGVVPMRWKEHPFQWVKGVYYNVIRDYRGGPLKRFFGGIELEDAETVLSNGLHATRVRIFAEFTPANVLGILAIPIVGVSSMRKTMKYLHSSVRLQEQDKEHLLPQPPGAYTVNREELNRLIIELHKVSEDEPMVQSLREHLQLTLFFSDLLGSTAFYEQVGDAHAYGQVRKHFDFLVNWVNVNKGTLVKTIGDAVMAVFEYPENAVKTALDIQMHADEFNHKYPSDTPIVIKIGLYHGPAIVVNSNNILDYFGRTVNLAARTQGLSVGHDVVISRECLERPGVQALLQLHPVQIELFEQKLKGIDEVIQLARVRVMASTERDS